MRTPRVEFDLGKIRANSTILCERLRSVGIDVKGVTKGVGGDSQIAAAMLDGGVTGLADARLSNVLKLRTNGINCPIALIRSPMHDQLAELVASCTISYHSDLTTLDLLGQAARDANRCHSVMLMVEAGDGRDGLPIERLEHFVAAVLNTPRTHAKWRWGQFLLHASSTPHFSGPDGLVKRYRARRVLLENQDSLYLRWKLYLAALGIGARKLGPR